MFSPRIIPVLLLKDSGLVKSSKFKKYNYIGDPINAVKLFNELYADELVFLDIEASKNNKLISLDFIKNVAEEANMPFAVGGGIKSLDDIRKILNSGSDKVILNSSAVGNPNFIKESADQFGSSTITVCLDIKKTMFGQQKVWTHGGTKKSKYNPQEFAKIAEELGAGELIIQSIEKDGTMEGYDIDLLKSISVNSTIPITALGGASTLDNLRDAHQLANVTGLAAGSLFIYQGKKRGVLINYPNKKEIKF